MLGRGVKRKRGVQEDRQVGDCQVADAESPPSVSYLQQRQQVLSLCLNKLQGCQMRSEPSLHRSVLLVNTLRQIQEEMRQEGLGPVAPPDVTASTVPDICPPSQCLSPVCGRQLSSVVTSIPKDLLELAGLDSCGGLLTCPGCSQEERDEEVEELKVSLISSSFSLTPPSLLSLDDPPSLEGRPWGGFHSLLGSIELLNSPGYLSDLALDDIFEDIDTSMYDASDMSSILALGPSRTSSLLGVDEGGRKTSNASLPSSAQLQLCFTEVNDLDHIMEVLVGS